MPTKKLSLLIEGREAIPVRAIPYVTVGFRFAPDEVARNLAGKDLDYIETITAYHIVDGVPKPVVESEWNSVIAALKGHEAKLRRTYPADADGRDDEGYAEWLRSAVENLPANAFVWRDEFEIALTKRLIRTSRAAAGANLDTEQRADAGADGQINLTPMASANVAAVVLAGFEDEIVYLMGELIYNGDFVDWKYWAKRSDISCAHAAKLCFVIDPIKWKRWAFAQGEIPEHLREKIEKLAAYLAERSKTWSLASLASEHGDAAPLGMRNAAAITDSESAPAGSIPTQVQPGARKKWDDDSLNVLWREFNEPGATQHKLAKKYQISRQRVSKLLQRAKDRHRRATKKNSWT